MWHDMFVVQVPIAEKVLRTVLVYVIIVALFRFSGKRGLANLNTFDFVVIFLLANVVQNAIIGSDNSLLGGVIGAVTLVALNALLNRWLAADSRVALIAEGASTTVIKDGSISKSASKRLALRPSELEHAVRLQNGETVDDVALGSLEPDGHLVIVLKPSKTQASRGDIDRLEERLTTIETLLRSNAAGSHPESPERDTTP
ncbi:DUF421 domain-containing protein [Streptomyces sp. NBC_01260]|uniref:DUF421 domain-containing protein n=1 Tax=unclassified Streptomyces TaxID=2593676 RepID=UPI000F47566E|nr:MULTISPECIES: YetF domain-containing protein [unclassified Streptomyces]MCX4774390.1 DUF421 domain-containing protein [Streptomyces sp. NBC_01285]ROQ73130.1 uncharacterized protein DUF421 [Streptomyces sp. CEV 2-1]RPK35895.1 hypothetical protein EES39_32615 [Streptomyces sp. ADI92-24]